MEINKTIQMIIGICYGMSLFFIIPAIYYCMYPKGDDSLTFLGKIGIVYLSIAAPIGILLIVLRLTGIITLA